MPFPNTIDSFTAPSGTNLLTSPDHANLHATGGSAIVNIETFIGTSAANNGQFNSFTAGQTPLPINTGTLGTTITNGTFNTSTFGTPTLTGAVINGTAQTITNLGTNMFQTGQFLRLLDNTQNWKIQMGTVALGTIAAGGNVSAAITFPTPFTTIPIILTAPSGGTGAPSEGAYLTAVNDTLGTASFNLRVGNLTAGATGEVQGNWLAIGY